MWAEYLRCLRKSLLRGRVGDRVDTWFGRMNVSKEGCKQRNGKKLGQILRKYFFSLLINGSLLDIVSPRPDTETLRGHRPEASK